MKEEFIIYALIGISGTGKSYLTKFALDTCQNKLTKLIAVTTRKRRSQERDGIDKYFLSDEQFETEKQHLVLVRSMYGARYGFWADDFNLEKSCIVELFYKDYLQMKKEGYPVKGIYLWTSDHQYRRNLMKKRHGNKTDYIKREIADISNNFFHKIMFKAGLFDYTICNHYDDNSKKEILDIVKSKGK